MPASLSFPAQGLSAGFYPKVIGAGGFVTGMDIAADGTIIARTDTYNAYILDPGTTEWKLQLKPGVNCDIADFDLFYEQSSPWGFCGTYDVAIAKSNSQVRYLVCMGYIWRTLNGGTLYTRLPLAQQIDCLPNEPNRKGGKPLAVDPQNPAHVWFGAPMAGVRCSTDSGANWTLISTATLPLPTVGHRYIIAFDPSSSVSGGLKQGIYIFVPGSGLYKSINAGSSWTAITAPTNDPLVASHINIDSTGRLYLTGKGGENNSAVRIWNGTSWSESTKQAKTIAISPHVAGHVYAVNSGGNIDLSTDNGVTWSVGGTGGANPVRVADKIGWHTYTDEAHMANGDCKFDPLQNRLIVVEGIGAWRTGAPPTSMTFATTFNITEMSDGIENMVTSTITVAPDGNVGYTCHDRGCFIIPKGQAGITYPSKHGGSRYFNHGTACDFAPEDTNFWVTTMTGEIGAPAGTTRETAYTTDRGETWTALNTFGDTAGGIGGGQIAVLSKDIWLQAGQAGKALADNVARNALYLTTNRGATWTALMLGDNLAIMAHDQYVHSRRTLIHDRHVPGRAYFYNVGLGDNSSGTSQLACRGIWRIDVNLTTGVPTIARVKSTYIISGGADGYHGKLTQVGPDEFLWCGGDNGMGLWRSTNGMGDPWTEVTGTDNLGTGSKFAEVFSVGVGKAAPGSSYKTLLVSGYRMNVPIGGSMTDIGKYGFWLSTDNGVTWTRVAQFPGNMFDVANDIAGDDTKYGRFFIGWGDAGMSLLQL